MDCAQARTIVVLAAERGMPEDDKDALEHALAHAMDCRECRRRFSALVRAIVAPVGEEITCAECRAALHEYLDLAFAGRDAAGERPIVASHLAVCESCHADFTMARSLLQAIDASEWVLDVDESVLDYGFLREALAGGQVARGWSDWLAGRIRHPGPQEAVRGVASSLMLIAHATASAAWRGTRSVVIGLRRMAAVTLQGPRLGAALATVGIAVALVMALVLDRASPGPPQNLVMSVDEASSAHEGQLVPDGSAASETDEAARLRLPLFPLSPANRARVAGSVLLEWSPSAPADDVTYDVLTCWGADCTPSTRIAQTCSPSLRWCPDRGPGPYRWRIRAPVTVHDATRLQVGPISEFLWAGGPCAASRGP